jgi:hypothetical protein
MNLSTTNSAFKNKHNVHMMKKCQKPPILKKLVIETDNIFNNMPLNLHIGMNRSQSIYQAKVNYDKQQKKLMKKAKQQKSGREAQQDGENVKNLLVNKWSYKGNPLEITPQAKMLIEEFGYDIKDVEFVNTKAYADGKIACAKSDAKITIKLKNQKQDIGQMSIKSTYKSTQLSVHSVNSFEKNLTDSGIVFPPEVKEFLSLFTYSEVLMPNKPNFIFPESIRRKRYSKEEIDAFNPDLWHQTQLFFEKVAEKIMKFLISIGSETNSKNYANKIAFCDKKANDLMIIDVDKLIKYALDKAGSENSFCVANKPTKNGTTTFSLYAGLITCQMKGSGDGASYHNLQFKICGKNLKKLKENGCI